VLQIRAVEFAMKYRVPLWVRSSFSDDPGTLCCEEEDAPMEHVIVSGIAYDRNEAKLSVRGVPDRPGVAARIFKPLSDANIVVDLIVQNVGHGGKANLTFTVPRADLPKALDIVKRSAAELSADAVESDDQIAKVSVVGVGMRNHAGVAARAFEVLAAAGINIEMISTSEIKISVVIAQKFVELAIRELHAAFGLDRRR
jgi:aspartate kinase